MIDFFFLLLLHFRMQHEIYPSCKQIGISEVEARHAVKFPACANMGSASLMRDLQWHRYVKN